MAKKDATQDDQGAKPTEEDVKKQVEQRIAQQGPRARDEYASVIAQQRRAQRDEENLEALRERGIENPEIPDTLQFDPNEIKTPIEAKEEERAAQLKAEEDAINAELMTDEEKAAAAEAEEAAKNTDKSKEDNSAKDGDSDLVEVVIYGESEMVPKSKVDEAGGLVAYQKHRAAEYKLNQAKEQAAKILEEARQTSGLSQEPSPDQSRGESEKTPAIGVSMDRLQATVEAMQDGTVEEGVEALQDLLSQIGGQSQSNDPNELVSMVVARIDHNAAMQQFEKAYPDIMSDPKLLSMVTARDGELINSGDTRPDSVRYMEIGQEIMEWVASKGGGSTKQNGESMEQRQQRKEAADPEPPKASLRANQGAGGEAETSTPQRKTPRQTIAEMARARGQ